MTTTSPSTVNDKLMSVLDGGVGDAVINLGITANPYNVMVGAIIDPLSDILDDMEDNVYSHVLRLIGW